MDTFVRKIIYKIPLLYSICKDIVEYKNKKFYQKMKKEHKTIEEIDLKKLKHDDECYIVGNGPSINSYDLELIRNKDCFASNLIFKIFEETDWRPRFYFIQDRYARIGDFLNNTEIKYLFIGDYFWRTRKFYNKNAYCYHLKRVKNENEIKFSHNVYECIYDSCTVTYTMIQMAIFMGYKKIYLLGIDHNYNFIFDKTGKVVEKNIKKSHFFDDEKPKEVIANVFMMEAGYLKAKEEAEKLDIAIFNVTRGGNLNCFLRKNLEETL